MNQQPTDPPPSVPWPPSDPPEPCAFCKGTKRLPNPRGGPKLVCQHCLNTGAEPAADAPAAPGEPRYRVRSPDGPRTISQAECDELMDAVFAPLDPAMEPAAGNPAHGLPVEFSHALDDELYGKAPAAPGTVIGQWSPVSDDNIPELDTPVWMIVPTSWGPSMMIGARVNSELGWLWARCYQVPGYYDGKWDIDDAEEDDLEPTHWQPLPQPPANGVLALPVAGVPGADEEESE